MTKDLAEEMTQGLETDRDAFFDGFVTDFSSLDGKLAVTEEQRQAAIWLSGQSDQRAALGCMEAFGTTDFREDLPNVPVPTLVVHGDSDAVVPFEGFGAHTHAAIAGSELVVCPAQVEREPPGPFHRALGGQWGCRTRPRRTRRARLADRRLDGLEDPQRSRNPPSPDAVLVEEAADDL